MLEIRVLGGLSAIAEGEPVELPPSARARALLAWLAVHPGAHPRGALAGRLRPDALDESARKSLRQAAWALRGALGPGADAWLVSEREFLGLSSDPSLVRVDLAEFRRLVAAGRLADALALADGDLLAGLDEEWADRRREEHRWWRCSASWRRTPRRRATSPPRSTGAGAGRWPTRWASGPRAT